MAHRLLHLSRSTWESFAELASTDQGAMALQALDDTGWSGIRHLASAQRSLADAAQAARHLEADTPADADAAGDDATAATTLHQGSPPAASAGSSSDEAPAALLEVTWICRAAEDLAALLEQAARHAASADDEATHDALMTLAADSITEAERHVALARAQAAKVGRAHTTAT